jgi:hypothetical protein
MSQSEPKEDSRHRVVNEFTRVRTTALIYLPSPIPQRDLGGQDATLIDSDLRRSIDRSLNSLSGWDMESDFGLLWIPAGFVLIFLSVAVLFLTVSA